MTVYELADTLNMLIDNGDGDLTLWFDEGEQCMEIGRVSKAEIVGVGKVIVLDEQRCQVEFQKTDISTNKEII